MSNNITKYDFTDGSLFTLSGTNYVGYFNVVSGAAYAGKYTQVIALTNQNNVRNSVTISSKFFNRLVTQNFTLSHPLSDFIFQSGEFVNKNAINVKIDKAFDNFMDVYRACFMASSNLPNNFINFAALSSTSSGLSINWGTSATSLAVSSSALSALYPQIQSSSLINYIPCKYSLNKTLVVTNSASLYVFVINPTASTFTFVFSSAYISTNNALDYNQLTFGNITSTAKNNTDLYLCDKGNKIIYAYDITDVLAEDRALGRQFNLRNSINQQQALFVSPKLIEASDDVVFVYDDSTNVIYFYDKDFNHINSYANSVYFQAHPPVDLTYYKPLNQLFVLTSDFNIAVINMDATSTLIAMLTAFTLPNEQAKKLVFSNTNSDVFYLMTNLSLYKKFVSNPEPSIGNFTFTYTYDNSQVPVQWDTYSTNWSAANINWDYGPKSSNFTASSANNVYDIDTFESNLSGDNLLLYAFNAFINYNETTTFNSILK